MRHLDNLVLKNGLIAGFLCAALIFALGWTAWIMNPLHHRLGLVAFAAALSFAAVMGYVHYLNRNLVRPIMRLLALEPPAPGPSRVWAFQQLEDAIRRLFELRGISVQQLLAVASAA